MKQEKFEHDTFFHVYNRGNNKEDIFIEDKNYSYFLKLIKDHLLGVAEIYAYCLLKNHFHLIIRIKDKGLLKQNNTRSDLYLKINIIIDYERV